MAKKTKTPQDRNTPQTNERGSVVGFRASQSAPPGERVASSERNTATIERATATIDRQTAPSADERDGQIDRERIAARAYELYLQRGGSGGGELEDWLAAEREVTPASGQRTRE